MFVDARSGRGGQRVDTDVCIVGGGPSGLALALGLLHSGLRVTLLEAGPLQPDLDNQRLARGQVSGLPYYRLEDSRARAFGGTAHLWNIDLGGGSPALRLRRLDPIDFTERPWVPWSGWPITARELSLDYQRAEEFFGIDGVDYTPELPTATEPLLSNGVLQPTLVRFGRAEAVLRHEAVLRRSDKVTVMLGAIAVQLDRTPDGDVERVHAMSLTGNDITVEARAYVLAAGGIENARLLLLNTAGWGLGLDQVGRFFMEHPHTRAGYVIRRGPVPSLEREIRHIGGSPAELWFRIEDRLAPDEGLGNVMFSLQPVPMGAFFRSSLSAASPDRSAAMRRFGRRLVSDAETPSQSMRLAVTAVPPVVAALGRRVKATAAPLARPNREKGLMAYRVDVMAEQFPGPESRVTLSEELDAIGLPLAHLEWELSPETRQSLQAASDVLGRVVEDSGFGNFVTSSRDAGLPLYGGYHHMGTTRMHRDPAFGVVDADSKVHGTERLYVAGSSVFPTSGASNPTLTAVALCFRLADHLVGRLT